MGPGGYGARDVAALLGVTLPRLRAWVRAGFIAPERDERGELRFSFQDLVVLRAAAGLVDAKVPASTVKRALERLRAQLPEGRPLTGVHIRADGKRIEARDGGARWNPLSGQVLLDFEVADLADQVAALPLRKISDGSSEQRLSAGDWYEWAAGLEEAAPEQAIDAYRRALEIDPQHGEARVNLGRLLHEAGDPAAGAVEYRRALDGNPADVTAAFNLGVALEDLGRPRDAAAAYLAAVAADPGCADAHKNLARIYEALGDGAAALRHWKDYRRLTRA